MNWFVPGPAVAAFVVSLQTLLLALHWCAVNLLVGIAFQLTLARTSELNLQRRLASALPAALSLSMILGVGSLIFLQQAHGERFVIAGEQIATAWFAAGAALLVAWGASLWNWRRGHAGRNLGLTARALPLLGLALFAYVLVASISLGEKHAVMARVQAGDTALAWTETGTMQRWFHEFLGAIALGSIYLLALAWRRRAENAAEADAWARRAVRTAFVVTGIGILGGVCTLLKAPSEVGGPLPGILLTVGIVAGLAVPFHMQMAWSRAKPRLIVVAAGLAALCLLAKAGLRLSIRQHRLADAAALEPSASPAAPTLIAIVAAAVGALLLLGWLVRLRPAR